MRSSRKKRRWKSIIHVIRDISKTALFLAALSLTVFLVDNLSVTTLEGTAKVVDGDSLRLDDNRLRLLGIDAPELDQNCQRDGEDWKCGLEARRALSQLVGPELECSVHGTDRYDRQLVICRSGGVEINAAMVEAGWAVNYGGYGREERTAKSARHGLWTGSFDRPQEWRRQRRLDALDRKDMELANSLKMTLMRWWRGVFD